MPPVVENIEEYFWQRVNKTPDCWIWTGSVGSHGYGDLRVKGRLHLAHRFAYELTFGSIPDGKFVCHHCDNPRCVNPDHLFTGTHSDNMQDMLSKGRESRTHQVRGTDHYATTITEDDVRDIRRRRRKGDLLREIASDYELTTAAISQIARGGTWSHVQD